MGLSQVKVLKDEEKLEIRQIVRTVGNVEKKVILHDLVMILRSHIESKLQVGHCTS